MIFSFLAGHAGMHGISWETSVFNFHHFNSTCCIKVKCGYFCIIPPVWVSAAGWGLENWRPWGHRLAGRRVTDWRPDRPEFSSRNFAKNESIRFLNGCAFMSYPAGQLSHTENDAVSRQCSGRSAHCCRQSVQLFTQRLFKPQFCVIQLYWRHTDPRKRWHCFCK